MSSGPAAWNMLSRASLVYLRGASRLDQRFDTQRMIDGGVANVQSKCLHDSHQGRDVGGIVNNSLAHALRSGTRSVQYLISSSFGEGSGPDRAPIMNWQ